MARPGTNCHALPDGSLAIDAKTRFSARRVRPTQLDVDCCRAFKFIWSSDSHRFCLIFVPPLLYRGGQESQKNKKGGKDVQKGGRRGMAQAMGGKTQWRDKLKLSYHHLKSSQALVMAFVGDLTAGYWCPPSRSVRFQQCCCSRV